MTLLSPSDLSPGLCSFEELRIRDQPGTHCLLVICQLELGNTFQLFKQFNTTCMLRFFKTWQQMTFVKGLS